LVASEFCDHDGPAIARALQEIVESSGAGDQRAVAAAAFAFVRDEIHYTLGPWGVSASTTLERRAGMCTNKANLLIALLRRAGIPAAYGVLSVNAREYFGVIGAPFLTQYMSSTSTHVYAAALIDGRWIKCDPSTDSELANRTAHFCRQTVLIEWDAVHDSMDFLEPRHVYADLGLFADIADRLARPARGATPARMQLWNDYIAFIRREPAFDSIESLLDAYTGRDETAVLIEVADGGEVVAAAASEGRKPPQS
ncbi:MAG TPA: transglutaminase family protein, partial [Solirubrobacteraceae bacterium]|nr:transglutaminase family protein [Solirubrobacteraceae bacterium]